MCPLCAHAPRETTVNGGNRGISAAWREDDDGTRRGASEGAKALDFCGFYEGALTRAHVFRHKFISVAVGAPRS